MTKKVKSPVEVISRIGSFRDSFLFIITFTTLIGFSLFFVHMKFEWYLGAMICIFVYAMLFDGGARIDVFEDGFLIRKWFGLMNRRIAIEHIVMFQEYKSRIGIIEIVYFSSERQQMKILVPVSKIKGHAALIELLKKHGFRIFFSKRNELRAIRDSNPAAEYSKAGTISGDY